MAVLQRKRTLSKLEFYANAIRLRKSLCFLLLRDFGVKSKVRNLGIRSRPMDEAAQARFAGLVAKYGLSEELSKYPAWLTGEGKAALGKAMDKLTQSMNEEDKDEFLSIAFSYAMTCLTSEFPEWFISKLRDSIWIASRDLVANIAHAYTIWATTKEEAALRRSFQDKAIGDAENILQELTLAIEVLPIDAEKLVPVVEQIEKEIALLKGWRKKDNKRAKELN